MGKSILYYGDDLDILRCYMGFVAATLSAFVAGGYYGEGGLSSPCRASRRKVQGA